MKTVVLLLLAILMVGCEEPEGSSRIGNNWGNGDTAVIVLSSGEEVECIVAKQIEAGGWECIFTDPDSKREGKRWFDDGIVQEVIEKDN